MGRLSGRGLPSRLGRSKSRFRSAATSEAERSRHRAATQPWRAWYNKPRWQRLRVDILFRDSESFEDRPELVPLTIWPSFKESVQFRSQPWRWPVCQQTGVLLIGGRTEPNSAVVDHIKPHRGDPDLFWDPENLQASSKAYHDKVKQSLEKRGLA